MKFWKRYREPKEPVESSKSASENRKPEDRDLMAESLDRRVLYSGSPLQIDLPDVSVHVAPALIQSGSQFNSLDGFGGDRADLEEGSCVEEAAVETDLTQFSEDELAELAGTVIDRGRKVDLDEDQREILSTIEVAMMDISSLSDPGEFELEDIAAIPDVLGDPLVLDTARVDSGEGIASAIPGDDEMRQFSLALIADLLKEVDGPIHLEGLAQAQMARRTVEVEQGHQPVRLSSFDLMTNSSEQRWFRSALKRAQVNDVDSTEFQVFEIEGADLGYAAGSRIYIDDQLDHFLTVEDVIDSLEG